MLCDAAEPQHRNLQPRIPASRERSLPLFFPSFSTAYLGNLIQQLGVLFYQSRVREFVENHLAREKAMGREWNPAQPVSQVEASGVGCLEGGMKDIVCHSLGPEMLW